MIVDNYDKIVPLFDFGDKQDEYFYFLQIFQRRKENPSLVINNKLIDNFYLYSGDLERKWQRIKELCRKMNARAYIRMNRRSAASVGLRCLTKTAEMIEQGNFKHIKRIYESAAGTVNSEKPKRWLIDLDEEHLTNKDVISKIITDIGGKILVELPTLNGVHLITNAFNSQQFYKELARVNISIDIHKDNPTLLYYEG
jgi:hypothetical protein